MFTLRPEQLEFKHAVAGAFAKGARTVIGVLATGGGKSVIAADMAAGAVSKGRSVLVITGRRQIVYQLHDHCNRNGIDTGIVMGSDSFNPQAPVRVASIQTLQRRGFSHAGEPQFVIVDECHQFFNTTCKIIKDIWPTVPFLGFTATPVGPGGRRISHFEQIVEPVKNSELVAAGSLLPVHPYLAPSQPDLGGIDLKRASQDEIGQRVDACTLWGDVFREWEPYRHLQTMVVLPSRAVCRGFLRQCLGRGIRAKIVDGTTLQDERDKTFAAFRDEECEMLLGVDVIREGLDLPIAQCLIDLHPTHQYRTWWQTIGRIKRPYPGQQSAVVIDFAGNIDRHLVHPDQDPPWEELTDDESIEDVIERKAGVRCPKCGSKDIYSIKGHGYKCEQCQHEWQPTKPWVCPHCKQALAAWQKVIGGKCPNCGEKVGTKQVRHIRMGDGTMRVVSAHEIKRRKKSKADHEQSTWDKFRYIAHFKSQTLGWARIMYQRERGQWPPSHLKNCPDTPDSGDWKRRPSEVYPWMDRRKRKS